MENVKKIIGDNLAHLRKNAKLTQAELAEKLGYTDKAVSTWEKGTALPDAEVLSKLAEFYDVDMNYLFSEHDPNEKVRRPSEAKQVSKRTKLLIISFVVVLIFLLATVIFVYMTIYTTGGSDVGDVARPIWMTWLWAVVASLVVIAIFCAYYWKDQRLYTFVFSSVAVWVGLIATCLQGQLGDVNLWITLIVGVPIQVLLAIWFGFGNRKKKKEGKTEEVEQKESTTM